MKKQMKRFLTACAPLAVLLVLSFSSTARADLLTVGRSQLALRAASGVKYTDSQTANYYWDPGGTGPYIYPPRSGSLDPLFVFVNAEMAGSTATGKADAGWSGDGTQGYVNFYKLAAYAPGCLNCYAEVTGPLNYLPGATFGNGWAYEFTPQGPGTYTISLLFSGDPGNYLVQLVNLSSPQDSQWVLYDPLVPDGLTDQRTWPLVAGETYIAHIAPFFGGQSLFGIPVDVSGAAFFAFDIDVKSIPESSTMLFLGSGLLGLWGFRKKVRK